MEKSEISKWTDKKLKKPENVFSNVPISISGVLKKKRIVFLKNTTKEDALSELAHVLASAPQIHSQEDLMEHIYKREVLMSTGIGLGIAIPHVRLNTVDDIVMALGVCKKPLIDYESLDDIPIKIICMIAAHTDKHVRYIKLLSTISKVLKDEETRSRIINSNSKDEIISLFMGDK